MKLQILSWGCWSRFILGAGERKASSNLYTFLLLLGRNTHQSIAGGDISRERRQRAQCYMPRIPFANNPIRLPSISHSLLTFLGLFLPHFVLINDILSLGMKNESLTYWGDSSQQDQKKKLLPIPPSTGKLVLLCVIKLDMKILFLAEKSGKHPDLKYYSSGPPPGLC